MCLLFCKAKFPGFRKFLDSTRHKRPDRHLLIYHYSISLDLSHNLSLSLLNVVESLQIKFYFLHSRTLL